MSFFTRVFPHPILSVILLIVWLLLNNTIAPGHIVLGAILAIIIPMLTSSFWPERVCFRRFLIFVKFALIVAYDIVIANITVAKLILGANDKLKPRLFRLPLDIEHPLGISVLASTISLTPGTVSCDLSSDRSYLIIHALCLEDKQAGIDEIKQRYEKPLMEVFTKC